MKEIFRHDIEIYRRGENHFLKWSVKNQTSHRIPLKPGMALLDEERLGVHPRFQPIEWTSQEAIEPNEKVTLLDQQLYPDRIDNYRFNFEAYKTIGIEDIWNHRYYITEKQRKNIVKKLNELSDRELPKAWYLTKNDQDKQLNNALQGNGMQSIIEIHMIEGHNPDPENDPSRISLEKL